jgi:hypothetical protein
MEDATDQPREPTVEDQWPLDHHLEETLRAFTEAAGLRDSCREASEQQLDETHLDGRTASRPQ